MDPLRAALLGLIQGITEFLPISSSAHLILVPVFLGWEDQGLVFDIATNTGTLAAVMVYFRDDLAGILRQLGRGLGGEPVEVEGLPAGRLVGALVLGTVPVAVCGLLAYDWIAGAARDPMLIALASIVFGLALLWADQVGRRRRDLGQLQWLDALTIGVAQALALIPGTSRAGITLTAALLLGFQRPAAARFSFLLYIPVGLLVAAKDVLDLATGGVPDADWTALAVGAVTAAVSAYLVIRGLLAWLERRTLTVFVVYRVALGALILWLAG